MVVPLNFIGLGLRLLHYRHDHDDGAKDHYFGLLSRFAAAIN